MAKRCGECSLNFFHKRLWSRANELRVFTFAAFLLLAGPCDNIKTTLPKSDKTIPLTPRFHIFNRTTRNKLGVTAHVWTKTGDRFRVTLKGEDPEGLHKIRLEGSGTYRCSQGTEVQEFPYKSVSLEDVFHPDSNNQVLTESRLLADVDLGETFCPIGFAFDGGRFKFKAEVENFFGGKRMNDVSFSTGSVIIYYRLLAVTNCYADNLHSGLFKDIEFARLHNAVRECNSFFEIAGQGSFYLYRIYAIRNNSIIPEFEFDPSRLYIDVKPTNNRKEMYHAQTSWPNFFDSRDTDISQMVPHWAQKVIVPNFPGDSFAEVKGLVLIPHSHRYIRNVDDGRFALAYDTKIFTDTVPEMKPEFITVPVGPFGLSPKVVEQLMADELVFHMPGKKPEDR